MGGWGWGGALIGSTENLLSAMLCARIGSSIQEERTAALQEVGDRKRRKGSVPSPLLQPSLLRLSLSFSLFALTHVLVREGTCRSLMIQPFGCWRLQEQRIMSVLPLQRPLAMSSALRILRLQPHALSGYSEPLRWVSAAPRGLHAPV